MCASLRYLPMFLLAHSRGKFIKKEEKRKITFRIMLDADRMISVEILFQGNLTWKYNTA